MNPKCKCGERMKESRYAVDLNGYEMYTCECGMLMKKVPLGNPSKKSYLFFILLSIVVTKKKWLTPYPVQA